MTVPRWLLSEQAYVPRPDRDAFIDGSIRSMLRVVSRISARAGTEARRRTIDARVKLVSLLVVVLLVSLSRGGFFLLLAGAVTLLILAFQSARVLRDVLKVSVLAAGFSLAVLLPSSLWGNAPGMIRISMKVFICVSAARLLSATTPWGAMTRAMAALRAPDLFVLVLDVTILYIWLLGGISLDMLRALKARSVGRNTDKTTALSGIAGTLFLKSRAMADGLYAAMECRGFQGSYRTSRGPRIGLKDCAVLGADALLVAVFIVTGA